MVQRDAVEQDDGDREEGGEGHPGWDGALEREGEEDERGCRDYDGETGGRAAARSGERGGADADLGHGRRSPALGSRHKELV
jgi:hypothetical protein